MEFRYDERELRLRVRDNGRGIDATALADGEQPGHYGLVGMRERAELIGGKLTVWSAADSGHGNRIQPSCLARLRRCSCSASHGCAETLGTAAQSEPTLTIENPIRIMAVDDHPMIREGIAGLVSAQSDLKLVAEAIGGREAIQQFRIHRPDVTLMDIRMPEMSGLDAISAIRGEFPDARIIVLTTYAGDVQALRAMRAGAQAYLLKDSLRNELLDTIRAVHTGKKTLSPEVSFQLAEHLADDPLTPAEIRVLRSDCRRQCQQGNSRSALLEHRDRQRSSPQHSIQTARQRPNPRRHDRTEARDN